MLFSHIFHPFSSATALLLLIITGLSLPNVYGLDAEGDLVTLVSEGEARYSIVLPAEPTETETDAAEELLTVVRSISGVTLPMGEQTAAGLPLIRIGRAAGAQPALDGASEGTFTLKVAADGIDAVGVGEGTFFAICELLEQLGVRWFWPGELGTSIPSSETLRLKAQTTVQTPGFVGRHFQMPKKGNEWRRRVRCGGPNFPPAHGIGGISKTEFKEHPELFALVKGARTPRQLCVTNPEVIKRAVAAKKAYFAKNPDAEVAGIGPNDGAGFCECEDCLAKDAGDYDAYSGEPSVTDRYIWFFNQVLAGIEDEYPDKKLGFYIYHNYMRPPLREKPDPRITGALAPIALCRLHGPNNPVCPEKTYYKWLASEWGKLIPELWDRGYWSNLACPGFTFPLVHRLREQIPVGKEAGIYGWRVETFPHLITQTPGIYIAAKLMWNPKADVDALLQDFYERAFGPAAAPMGDYYTLLDARMRDADFHTGSSWDFPHIYTAEIREEATALLDAAGEAVKADSIEAKRVAAVRTSWDMTCAFVRMMNARVVSDFALAKRELEHVDAAAETLASAETPLIYNRLYVSYMNRFFRHATEQAYARTIDGNELLATAPDEWEFLLDPMQVGEDTQWYDPSLTGMNWQRAKTSSLSWSDQGLRYYRGVAWYRTTVTVPKGSAGRRVFLWCGGVDEKAKVWVNGQPIGVSHGAAIYPFEMDATGAVRDGKNQITIAVANLTVNELGTGGILAPVLLYAPAAGDAAELQNIRDLKPTFP